MATNQITQLLLANFSNGVFYHPKKNIRAKVKDAIKKTINIAYKDRYLFVDYDFFWTSALDAIAVYRVSHKYSQARGMLIDFYNKNKMQRISNLDSIMHGYVLLKLKEQGVDEFDALISKMAAFLLVDSPRSKGGVVPYRISNPELCFIDALGMICPFLVGYGKLFNNQDATDLGINQMIHYIRNGFSDSGLPYHAYDDEGRYGCVGWGRGVGWMLWGMSDMLEYLNKNTSEYDIIVHEYTKLASIVMNNQKKNGALSWVIGDPELEHDVSAVSMCAYSIMRGIELDILGDEFLCFLKKAVAFIDSCVKGDKVLQTSGECMGLGSYSNVFSFFPWGHAPSVIIKNYMADME